MKNVYFFQVKDLMDKVEHLLPEISIFGYVTVNRKLIPAVS